MARTFKRALGLGMSLVLLSGTGAAAATPGERRASGAPAVATSAVNLKNGKVWIHPTTVAMRDGSARTTYTLPNGSTMEMLTPPPDFKPLEASEATLAKYGFPLPSSDPEDLEAWTAAMKAYRWFPPETGPFLASNGRAPGMDYATVIKYWGGYSAGTRNVHNHMYVAVKGNFRVPTNSGTCSRSNQVAFWIGLGGTGGAYPSDNLVQQGIACGNSDHLGSGSAYRPWYQFAVTDDPHVMCGQTTWTLPAGNMIYQNMSFQTSNNRGYFYLEDQTSGRAHACNYGPPSGWHWNLNTAEWIGEALYESVNFGSVTFSNARAQLNSNGSWVTLGSQSITEYITGQSEPGYPARKCIDPGAISSGTSFVDYWVSPGICRGTL